MVQLAQALGVSGISSESDVDTSKLGTANKNKLLKALKDAKFAKTGMVNASGNSLMRSIGEDGMVAVRDKEIILDQTDSKTFKDFVPTMNNFMQQFKPNIPDFSKLTTNNNSSPIFKFDNMINITGSVTGVDGASKIKSAGDDIVKKLYEVYRVK